MTLVPLSSISPDAEAIQNNLYASIEEQIRSEALSQGLKKQYSAQLEHIYRKEPSCEVLFAQGPFSGPSK